MQLLGISADQLQQQPTTVELWPEHLAPFELFCAMLTQWRMGMAGPVGLDYAVLPWVADQLRFSARKLREAFRGLQAMERVALAIMAERQG